MAVYVEILYTNLTTKKEKIGEIDKLPKDGVLFILVKDDEREGKLKNIMSCHGFDHYALCQKRNNSQDWAMLFGWDEDDYTWKRISKCDGCKAKEVVEVPLGVMHVVFHGGSVSQAKWKKAQKIIGEMT